MRQTDLRICHPLIKVQKMELVIFSHLKFQAGFIYNFLNPILHLIISSNLDVKCIFLFALIS